MSGRSCLRIAARLGILESEWIRIDRFEIRERGGCCCVSCVPIKNRERGEQHIV